MRAVKQGKVGYRGGGRWVMKQAGIMVPQLLIYEKLASIMDYIGAGYVREACMLRTRRSILGQVGDEAGGHHGARLG